MPVSEVTLGPQECLQACPTGVSHKNVRRACATRVPARVSDESVPRVYKSVPQACSTTVCDKSVPQEFATSVSHKAVLQERSARVSHESAVQECPTRVTYRKSLRQECPTRVTFKSVAQECPTRVFLKSVPQVFRQSECPPQECSARASRKSDIQESHNSVPQECPTRMTDKSVPQECSARVSYKVSHKSAQECPATFPDKNASYKSVPTEFPQESYKSVSQECGRRVYHERVVRECPTRVPTRVSDKSVPQEWPTRVSYKSVPQECPTRVSHTSALYRSVLQECPATVSCKNVRQERPRRVSRKSAPQAGKRVLQKCRAAVSSQRSGKLGCNVGSSSWEPWPQDRPLSRNVARKATSGPSRLRTGNFSCDLTTAHLGVQM